MKDFQYIALADKFELSINNGTYPVGAKLPSLRSIRQQFKISVGTILKAFTLLEDKGLVAGKERSGFVVLRTSVSSVNLPKQAENNTLAQKIAIGKVLQEVSFPDSENKSYVSFFNAVLHPDLLPFNALRRSLQQASRDLTGQHLQYEPSAGNSLLRAEIARRSFLWQGNLVADDIVITNGALEAVSLCLRAVTKAADTVLVQSPIYHGILQTIESLDLKVIEFSGCPLTGINIQELEEICSSQTISACLLISNFNNPNGITLNNEQKSAIVAFAEKMQVPVIEDDIYGDLHFQAQRPTTIKSYDEHGWVMLCSSFSKSAAPGYRIGWCAAGRFTEQVIKLKAVTNVATASIVQSSLLQLLKTGAYDRHLRKLRPELHRLMLLTIQAIEKYFPPDIRMSRPEGGLVVWIELPAHIDAFELQKKAIDQFVNFAPGPLFSNHGDYRNYIRISCNNLWNVKVENALKRLGDIIKSM
ncbi:DNA-binding transcriptional MocR family regulator [Chryseobacterium sediminis]|uniref:DNA-binding transcriptional MocR family regulator n=1 Tax=Chryseobacterium sediminis TaxID=1679494 RepID=A0ABR6PX82_9FLAO|nr:PLP-dependent aminotransferase family protein [Chryseobacterium sediminis]MBB6330322.1 DNA-binding transcriptional MocR family regulator [Chryseobacterium sediminis]